MTPTEQIQQALHNPTFVDKAVGWLLALFGGSGITYQMVERTLSLTAVSDDEPDAEAWCIQQYGGIWKGSKPGRKHRPSRGAKYDQGRDAFVGSQPFTSWVFDEVICTWRPPVPRPEGNPNDHYWDEPTKGWEKSSQSPLDNPL